MESEKLSAKSLQLLLLADHLRFRLHADREARLIRDRRYHLRTYPCCLVGRELIDWLVKHGEVGSRNVAVQCMCILQENGLIHHVCDDHSFKDEMLFYRFRRDDNSLVLSPEAELFLKCSDIYHKMTEDYRFVKPRQCHDTVFRNCFVSTEMIDWLIENGEVTDRVHAVKLGRQLLDYGLINHVTNENHFIDGDLYYQFTIEKVLAMKLAAFLCPQELTQPTLGGSPLAQRRNPMMKNQLPPLKTGRSSPVPFRKQRTIEDAVNEFRRSPGSPDISPSSLSPSGSSPRPVILREVTVEELTDPNGPYTTKAIKIMSDAVGFGFVVRGTAPVYVQTVDPKGPAAAAGLKVRMFIRNVNGKDALYWSHKQVTEEVLQGQNVVELMVITHFKGT